MKSERHAYKREYKKEKIKKKKKISSVVGRGDNTIIPFILDKVLR